MNPLLQPASDLLSDEIEEFLSAINAARLADEVFSILERQLVRIGFTKYAYVLFFPKSSAFQLCVATYPFDWAKHYQEGRLDKDDLVAKLSAASFEPFIWNNLSERYDLTKKQKDILGQSADAGLVSGATIPLHGRTREKGLLSVACDMHPNEFIKYFKYRQHQLHLIGLYAHEKIMSLRLDVVQELGLSLTDRELEVLAWSAQGKSHVDIATILGVSGTHINKTLMRLRDKLNCINTTHAVAVASFQGIITPLDSGVIIRKSST